MATGQSQQYRPQVDILQDLHLHAYRFCVRARAQGKTACSSFLGTGCGACLGISTGLKRRPALVVLGSFESRPSAPGTLSQCEGPPPSETRRLCFHCHQTPLPGHHISFAAGSLGTGGPQSALRPSDLARAAERPRSAMAGAGAEGEGCG